jgi:adenosylcobinamide-GDP ribazoletransferase
MTLKKASELDYFWAALMFYTRIPVPRGALHSQEVLDRSRKYFPLIGFLVGLIAVLTFVIANHVFDTALSIALSMVASILATGAFHEDGFADSCDGFGGGWNRDQVLTIMKDSRLGTYATLGLILLLGVKFLALLELALLKNTMIFIAVYLSAHTLSRFVSSLMIDLFDYVQDIDSSKVKPITEQKLGLTEILTSSVITILPLVLLASFSLFTAIISSLVSCLTAFLFMAYSKRRIGGYTGDVLGAIQQLSEVSFYLCFLALL